MFLFFFCSPLPILFFVCVCMCDFWSRSLSTSRFFVLFFYLSSPTQKFRILFFLSLKAINLTTSLQSNFPSLSFFFFVLNFVCCSPVFLFLFLFCSNVKPKKGFFFILPIFLTSWWFFFCFFFLCQMKINFEQLSKKKKKIFLSLKKH